MSPINKQIELLGQIDLIGIENIVVTVLDILNNDNGKFDIKKCITRLRKRKIVQTTFCGDYDKNILDFTICNIGKSENFLFKNRIHPKYFGPNFFELNVFDRLQEDSLILSYSKIKNGKCRDITRNPDKIINLPFSNDIKKSLFLKKDVELEDSSNDTDNFLRIMLILELTKILLKQDIFQTMLQHNPSANVYRKFTNSFNFAITGFLKHRRESPQPVLFLLSYVKYEGKSLPLEEIHTQILQCIHENFQKDPAILKILKKIRPDSKKPLSYAKTITIKPKIKDSNVNDVILFQVLGFIENRREFRTFAKEILREIFDQTDKLEWKYVGTYDEEYSQLDLR